MTGALWHWDQTYNLLLTRQHATVYLKVHDKLAILKDLIGVECLCVHFVVGVLVGQVEEHAKGEVQVVRLCQASLLTQPTSLKIFIKRHFSLFIGHND